LLEFFAAQLNSDFPDLGDDESARLSGILADYLHRRTAPSEASRLFASAAGPSAFFERVHAVAEAGDTPLPAQAPDGAAPASRRRRMQMWTPDEDARLLAGIYRFGPNSWAPIAKFVGPSRTRAQCAQRWNRGLNPAIRRHPWATDDDVRLLQLVGRYGERAWTIVSAAIGNRSDVQCRYHYFQLRKGLPPEVQAAVRRRADPIFGCPCPAWPPPLPTPMWQAPPARAAEQQRPHAAQHRPPQPAVGGPLAARRPLPTSLAELVRSLMNEH
jgi:hypothetical protein